jgi:AcrR family transcriptional regulator
LQHVARDTRTRILDTALRLFVSQGVEGVAVTEIEQGAGLSPGSGSFYRHFRSKADVLSAVVMREIDRAEVRRDTAGSGDLALDYTSSLALLDDLRPLIALLVRDGSRLPHLDRIRTVLAEGGTHLDAERLAARMAAGEIPPRDPEAVASVVLCALVGHHLAAQFFGGPVGVDRSRFVDALASLVSS